MAFRSSSSTSFTATTALTATAPAGVVAGDRLLAQVTQDSAAQTHTPATGWTLLSSAASLAAASPDGQTVTLFEKKLATGSDAYNFTSGGTQSAIVQVQAFSGRDNVAAAVLTPTTNTTANATPIAVSLGGVTATAGDDVAYFVQLDQVGQTDNWNLTAPASYTERQDVANLDFVTAACGSRDGVGAGATGSLTMTATRTAGSSGAGYSGYVVTVPGLAPTITVQPQSQTADHGGTATFTVTAAGTGVLHYQWRDDGANVGTDAATYSAYFGIADNRSQITVVVTDDVGSKTSGVAYLFIRRLVERPSKRRRRKSRPGWSGAGTFSSRAGAEGWFSQRLLQQPASSGGITAAAAPRAALTELAQAVKALASPAAARGAARSSALAGKAATTSAVERFGAAGSAVSTPSGGAPAVTTSAVDSLGGRGTSQTGKAAASSTSAAAAPRGTATAAKARTVPAADAAGARDAATSAKGAAGPANETAGPRATSAAVKAAGASAAGRAGSREAAAAATARTTPAVDAVAGRDAADASKTVQASQALDRAGARGQAIGTVGGGAPAITTSAISSAGGRGAAASGKAQATAVHGTAGTRSAALASKQMQASAQPKTGARAAASSAKSITAQLIARLGGRAQAGSESTHPGAVITSAVSRLGGRADAQAAAFLDAVVHGARGGQADRLLTRVPAEAIARGGSSQISRQTAAPLQRGRTPALTRK